MNDKKNIDRLFQERFKNFEATPSDAVWNNIEAKLNQKKKKRSVIPIWWRYAGVAALLLLLLTVGIDFFNQSPDLAPSNQVVDTEDNTRSSSNEKELHDNESKNSVAADNVPTPETNPDSIKEIENASDNLKDSNALKLAETSSEKNKLESEGSQKTTSNSLIKSKNPDALANNPEVYAERGRSKKNKKVIQEKIFENHDKSEEILDGKIKNNPAIAGNIEKETDNKVRENDSFDSTKTNVFTNNLKKSNSTIADTEEVQNKTIAENKEEKNKPTIEDILEESKNNLEKEERLNRWSISPNVAPVYFNTLSEGSSLGNEFNRNSKTSETNMSYGITASYSVNKKLSIRSGINKVNLGYNTNDVLILGTLAKSSTSSILSGNVSSLKKATGNTNISENMTLVSATNFESNKVPEALGFNAITSINQSITYIEVPLEIQYMLLDKKLGVNLIGGFSSFFLSGNELSSEDKNHLIRTEANNINDVSYSANLGFGFQYKFSKKLNLNLEPMFKYQINTFNNTSGNFTPYFIGVYTGIGFKF